MLGEAALRTLVCTPKTLAGQLDKLLSVTRLPAVELGIIGFAQPTPVFPFTAFSVRNDDLIVIERLTGTALKKTVRGPAAPCAASPRTSGHGTEARRLMATAAESLRSA